jgi:hypothetical protein
LSRSPDRLVFDSVEAGLIAGPTAAQGLSFGLQRDYTFLSSDRVGFLTALFSGGSMFDSLDEQIRKDEDRVTSSGQRMMRYAIYVAAAAVVFGGLILGVHLLT